jgi:hypothetical protein
MPRCRLLMADGSVCRPAASYDYTNRLILAKVPLGGLQTPFWGPSGMPVLPPLEFLIMWRKN